MTTYFIGGSVGTFCAGQGWSAAGWTGVHRGRIVCPDITGHQHLPKKILINI